MTIYTDSDYEIEDMRSQGGKYKNLLIGCTIITGATIALIVGGASYRWHNSFYKLYRSRTCKKILG